MFLWSGKLKTPKQLEAYGAFLKFNPVVNITLTIPAVPKRVIVPKGIWSYNFYLKKAQRYYAVKLYEARKTNVGFYWWKPIQHLRGKFEIEQDAIDLAELDAKKLNLPLINCIEDHTIYIAGNQRIPLKLMEQLGFTKEEIEAQAPFIKPPKPKLTTNDEDEPF